MHPWSGFTMQDHCPEHPTSAGLHFPGNNRGPRAIGLVTTRKLTSLRTAETWEVNSPTGQTGCFSHQLSHCITLSPLVCILCCSSHPSLRHRLDRSRPCWLISQWKVCICSLLSLLSRMHNYYLLLLIWFNRGLNTQPLPHKGKAVPNYTWGTCNPVNFTVLKSSD
jgi:hypothetical protein